MQNELESIFLHYKSSLKTNLGCCVLVQRDSKGPNETEGAGYPQCCCHEEEAEGLVGSPTGERRLKNGLYGCESTTEARTSLIVVCLQHAV